MTKNVNTPASREEIVQFITKKIAERGDNILPKDMQARMIEVLADEALGYKLSIKDMERESAKNVAMAKKIAEIRESGQPEMLMRTDPKTGEMMFALNLGTYGMVVPNDLTLFHDIYTALFRLSEDKEWIPYVEICGNIDCTEYVENWHMAVYMQICYSASQGILKLRGDTSNLEVKLIRNRGTNIIKKFVTSFDRPELDSWDKKLESDLV